MGHLAGLVLLTTLLAVTVLALGTEAKQVLEHDDFNGTDGTAPDSAMWEVVRTDTNEYCELRSNSLWTHSTGNGYSYVRGRTHHESNNLTLLVEYKMGAQSGRTIDLRINSFDGSQYYRWIMLGYDGDAGSGGVNYRYGGTEQSVGFSQDFVTGRWYIVNITVRVDRWNVTIKERDTGTSFLSFTDRACDPLGSDNYVHMGVYQYHSYLVADAYYDNYYLYNITIPPNKPPVWGPLPVLQAVEDVPITYDFSRNVSDPDDELDELSISSSSDYVESISRFNVTFLFPNGVTEAQVPIVLSDGRLSRVMAVEVHVTPVNDPPEHDIPTQMSAVEDTAKTLDLSAHVWDVDNAKGDLSLVVDDPFAIADGLLLTVNFTEGILDYNLTLAISDGIDSTPAFIHFVVQPVDDPPWIDPLPEFEAIEDSISVFNITPYINDVDTPVEELYIMERDDNCTVDGHDLRFLCEMGGISYQVQVVVGDAHSRASAMLTVTVLEVNDAPVIAGISPKMFVEDEAKTLDLSIYFSDEDNALEDLVLECNHHAVVEIVGLSITMNYTAWEPDHVVEIALFDGIARGLGQFPVQVTPVNDPPVILGLGGLQPPITVELDEGTERWFLIHVEDEDDTVFQYSVEAIWGDVEVYPNGTLRVAAAKGEVATYTVTLVVEDARGGEDRETVTISTLNVNDPPIDLLILNPTNHSVHEAGQPIFFSASFNDPDIKHGQELTTTWSSNLSAVLMVRTSGEDQAFSLDNLDVGIHRITVSVSDGEYRVSRWVELEVYEPIVSPPSDDATSFLTSPAGIGLLALVILIVLAIAIILVGRSRSEEEGRPEVASEEVPIVAEVTEDMPPSGGTPPIPGTVMKAGEGWVEDTTPGPETTEEPAPEPSPEVVAEREHDREVRDVMRALTQLPRGLPTSLWGRDLAELAREIVDGEARTAPDGTPLALIDGRWYIVDPRNVGTLLKEWRDEERGSQPLDPGDKASRIAQLEGRLLEGKISEETFERLRKKYEDEG